MLVLAPIDLAQNELQNAVIQNLAGDPGSPLEGQIWYNTTSNSLKARGDGVTKDLFAASGTGTVTHTGGALTLDALVVGNGSDDIKVVTTGTGVVTALGINTGSAGSIVLHGGAGVFSTITGTSSVTLGAASTTDGTIILHNSVNGFTTTVKTDAVAANRILTLSPTGDYTLTIAGTASVNGTNNGDTIALSTTPTSGFSSGNILATDGSTVTRIVPGAGVNTFLATPSSANLAAAVTDNTGTEALVFADTPTLVTPKAAQYFGMNDGLNPGGSLQMNASSQGQGGSFVANNSEGVGNSAGYVSVSAGAGNGASGGWFRAYGGTNTNCWGGRIDMIGGSSAEARGGDIAMYGGAFPAGHISTADGGGSIITNAVQGNNGVTSLNVATAKTLTLLATETVTLTAPTTSGTIALTSQLTGLLEFKGTTDCSANPNYPAASQGDAYVVSVAGKIGGASGTTVAVGDWFVAKADNAGGTEAGVGTDWTHIEHNLPSLGSLSTQDGTFTGNGTLATGGNTLTVAGTASISGTNTGDQTITLTGDVTGSGTGSFATTLANIPAISGANLTSLTAANITNSTTVGRNILNLTNPGAITFVKIAADNTVSTRTPAQMLSDIGAAGEPYTALIGDGASTSITITQATHGKRATRANLVAVYDASTDYQVYPNVKVANATGNVTLDFAVAPTSNQYAVVIIG